MRGTDWFFTHTHTHTLVSHMHLLTPHTPHTSAAVSPMKRKIETKYRLPLLNWSSLPATQISGTVFAHLDDESILRSLNFAEFEETFKLVKQGAPAVGGKV